jgi:hypothetical protein
MAKSDSVSRESLLSDPLFLGVLEDLLAKGLKPEEIDAHLEKGIPDALPKAASCLLDALKKSAPEMLADRRSIRRQFQRRHRKKWLRPFEMMRMLLEACREAGEECNDRCRPGASAEKDVVFDALVRLHARACLVGDEVLWLMEGGYASGAHARWRTLHELVVVAFFIEQKGAEVAERYLLHVAIESFKAANQYQEHCNALGQGPFSTEEMQQLKDRRDDLCTRFGKAYGTDWGWAAAALGCEKPTFFDIERAVSFEHMRPYFKLACYSNHAGCKGLIFDLGKALVPSGEEILLAGPSDAGMFDPGVCTARSMFQITANMILHREVSLTSLVTATALGQLAGEIEDAFATAEADLEKQANKEREGLNRRETRSREPEQ